MQFLTIFRYWFSSLSIFKPRALYALMFATCQRFIYGIYQTLALFWWVLLINLALNLIPKQYLLETFKIDLISDKSPLAIILGLFISISLLLLSAAFTLFVRSRSDQLSNVNYFKAFFIRLIHMRLMFFILFLLVVMLVVNLGITTLPKTSIWLFIPFHFLGTLTTFYWLDAPGSFRDIFISLERGTNLLIYNAPFFAVIIFFAIGSSWGLEYLLSRITKINENQPLIDAVFAFLKTLPEWLSIIITVAIKYLSVLVEFFMISILYSFFKQKRGKSYTNSFFE